MIREKIIRWLGGVPAEKGNLYEHAKDEMNLVWHEEDEMQDVIKDCVLDIVSVFSAQGHSGFSAPYTINVLTKLLAFEPLGPLTGEDHEWCWLDSGDEMKAQNKRDGRVFLRGDGSAYFIEGKVFREPSGACFTSKDSRVEVTFPFIPQTEYIDVEGEV